MPLRRKLKGRRPPQAVSVAAPALRMRCLCGANLEITAADDGKRRSCPSCKRRFNIRLTEGQKGVSLQFLTPENRATGETSAMDPSKGPNPHGLLLEPDPPDEAHFKCCCGALLSVAKSHYEKRVRCPACGARMLVFMLFDSSAGSFNFQYFSLVDRNSGTTQVLSRL